jgi:hypothetical protein
MCIFCIAALLMIGASLGSVALADLEDRLKGLSKDVRRAVDTESTVVWKATVAAKVPGKPAKEVPVAIHLYKQHRRVRIQILTHELSPAEAESVEDKICEALGAKIISRHFPNESELAEKTAKHTAAASSEAERQTARSESRKKQRLDG